MPDVAEEFEPILAYLNERTCHQCRARFRDDDTFARHIGYHRRPLENENWRKIQRTSEQSMAEDLVRLLGELDG